MFKKLSLYFTAGFDTHVHTTPDSGLTYTSLSTFATGQYVLVRLKTKRKQVNYVGVIEAVDSSEIEMSYLESNI